MNPSPGKVVVANDHPASRRGTFASMRPNRVIHSNDHAIYPVVILVCETVGDNKEPGYKEPGSRFPLSPTRV